MAKRLQAIATYRPRVDLIPTAKTEYVAEFIAQHTGLNFGEVRFVLDELLVALSFFLHSGQGVKLEGVGTFLPTLKLDGRVDVAYRPDPKLIRSLNRTKFRGRIKNRQHLGKTADELIALWNAEHPDDPVVE